MAPGSVVLFGAGSALIADYEESCLRRGIRIAAVIRNRDGQAWASDRKMLRVPGEIDAMLLRSGCLCPLFTPVNRRTAWHEASALGFAAAAALVDPHAVIASSSSVGAGGYINAGVVIGADVRIGGHAVINRLAGIGHHGRLGAFVSIGPGAIIAGQVEIGDEVLIGAGAVVLPGLRIGARAVVSAGSVVTRDLPADALVRGNPARPVGRGDGLRAET